MPDKKLRRSRGEDSNLILKRQRQSGREIQYRKYAFSRVARGAKKKTAVREEKSLMVGTSGGGRFDKQCSFD